tara:strand:- start:68252 stop:70378 length:2127 start_codon:yes stop_codon:yes gene_type:complete
VLTIRKLIFYLIAAIITIFLVVSCTDNKDGYTNPTDTFSYPSLDVVEDSVEEDIEVPDETLDAGEPDTYEKDCIKCDYYFCPPLSEVWQKEICIDHCTDPPTVVLEGKCEELLECDPTNHIMEKDIPCVTTEGYPGLKDKTCDKGHIYYTKCKTNCKPEECNFIDDDCDGEIDEGVRNACDECGEVPAEECDFIDNDCDGVVDNGVTNACGGCGKEPEEVCNGVDDDCDGLTDEGQLNACGKCGPLDEEICDGIDNDCNGLVDEDLIDKCSTDCEENLQYCVGGQWICTAKQPKEEICNGLDDDCDGKADEGLDCLCTINDIGTLFPCQESPLVCGAGYKTCECVDPLDPNCTELQLTECLAVCHWLPETTAPGTVCDKYLGEVKPEECNNHDDNCNQLIDELLFAGCYSGPPSTMYVGICIPGEMTCSEGKWGHYDDNDVFIKKLCLGEVTPEPEDICNGTDTNCDGEIDEDKELEPTDILLIVDLSGSMLEEINAVMTALNKFATHYSDSDMIKWGLVFTASSKGWAEEQVVLQTDLVDFETFMNIFENSGYTLMGGDEQNYDAIYLAIHNLLGAADVPYPLTDFVWQGWMTVESNPPAPEWNISWREDAKHVIILFSDEEGQSYLNPKIDEATLVGMIDAADELAVYAFTQDWLLQLGMSNNYVALTEAGMGGKAYPLTMQAITMYNNLLEILDETACGGKKSSP